MKAKDLITPHVSNHLPAYWLTIMISRLSKPVFLFISANCHHAVTEFREAQQEFPAPQPEFPERNTEYHTLHLKVFKMKQQVQQWSIKFRRLVINNRKEIQEFHQHFKNRLIYCMKFGNRLYSGKFVVY